MTEIHFPERLLIYVGRVRHIWVVRCDLVTRSGDLEQEGYLTAPIAREYAGWIRAAMADQPDRIRAVWMSQADRLEEAAGTVEQIDRLPRDMAAARDLIEREMERRRREE